MRIEISEEELQIVIRAMEHYADYLEAQQRSEQGVTDLLKALKKSPRR
jgi:predicted glycosyltransferase